MTTTTLISKVLIANRGEIAVRIIQTCRLMGIYTVAVHSDADANALFVQLADEAIALGGNTSMESYLVQDKIIAAAQRCKADAIHPGYGFLSENAEFARRCRHEGIIFIGPSPESIEAMGSKINAKDIAAKNGVPIIKGYRGTDQSEQRLAQEALHAGLPVLIKASAGGGGKGMRVARTPDELSEALATAKREALAAFGDDTLLIERYIESGKHIEVQIIGDQHGNTLYCFERECSIQRRFQKIVEEAPSPSLNDTLRKAIGEAAVAACKSIQYYNAGTVEFIFDTHTQEFFFLEVNTRLQVEHPVTEMITGLDLVALQIRIAQGEQLPITQNDLRINGHAIECRICAEDAADHFKPAIGTIHHYQQPQGSGIRTDSGIQSGTEVSVFYDPMLAKIIAHASTRNEAAAKMYKALGDLQILGVTTNRHYLAQIVKDPLFIHNQFDTKYIDKNQPRLAQQLQPTQHDIHQYLIAATLHQWHQRNTRRTLLKQLPSGWRNNFYIPQQTQFQITPDSDPIKVQYQHTNTPNQFTFNIHPHTYQVRFIQASDNHLTLSLDGHTQTYALAHDNSFYYIQAPANHTLRIGRVARFPEPLTQKIPGSYTAPMPGQIVKVVANLGDTVTEGTPLIVLSSMKMENTIYADISGTIQEIYVAEKSFVEAGTLLLRIQPAEA
jgi:acetyl-CoA carboxylase biotin carboxylase subunit